MDIHRCRFIPYPASAVNAVAFSHARSKTTKQQAQARLAVGRGNGDLEIWNPAHGTWHQELVITGGKDRSIDGLVWVNDPDQDLGDGHEMVGKSRLFSIGYTSTVTEWDLDRARPKKHASGQHGDIWCIAAQPLAMSEKNARAGVTQEQQAANKLVAGTIDGELVMYSVEDGDLRFQRVLVKSSKKTQMVSITFQSRRVVVVGCSDSTVRAYDIQTGRLIRRMTLGADLIEGAKHIIVWSVKCLPNGNVVSGDSTGQVCVWDGKTYTQSQRIQSHKQDVLSLAVSDDGSSILSGGMDRRTVLYKMNSGSGGRWSKVMGRRYHEHDVKTMATFEQGRTSVVVSGGPDTNLVVLPLKEMSRENHRVVNSLPQQSALISAPGSRFVISWWGQEVHVWTLKQTAAGILASEEADAGVDQNRKLLKTVVIKGEANIASASINEDGTLLVVATANQIKAFRMEHDRPQRSSDVTLSTLELPSKLTTSGASRVQLSPDGNWLCVVRDGGQVLMAQLHHEESRMQVSTARLSRVRRNIPSYVANGGLGRYNRNITHVTFSADSKVMAVADLAGYVDTWVLENSSEDTRDHETRDDADSSSDSDASSSGEKETTPSDLKWVRNPRAKMLPRLPASPVVLSFSNKVPASQSNTQSSADDYVLLAVTSSWQVLVFHPLQGSLTTWSRRHPKSALPAPIHDLIDVAKGVVWQGDRVWIYGVSFLLMLDMSQDLRESQPIAGGVSPNTEVAPLTPGQKRKRRGPTTGAGGRMVRGNLTPHTVTKHTADAADEMNMDTPADDQETLSEEDDDDDEAQDVPGDRVASRRNGQGAKVTSAIGTDGRRKWWITYKFRPILGVVPLNGHEEPLEVALVERPTWDLDMSDRYVGSSSGR